MKRNKTIFIVVIVAAVIASGCVLFLLKDRIINGLFAAQYNSNGVSHFLVITIDEDQQKEYVGILEDHRVYVEGLNIDETNFRTKDAKNLSIKDAIGNGSVSIKEWKKYAWNIKTDGNSEILQFDAYEIVVTNEDCLIRPLAR